MPLITSLTMPNVYLDYVTYLRAQAPHADYPDHPNPDHRELHRRQHLQALGVDEDPIVSRRVETMWTRRSPRRSATPRPGPTHAPRADGPPGLADRRSQARSASGTGHAAPIGASPSWHSTARSSNDTWYDGAPVGATPAACSDQNAWASWEANQA